MRNEHYDVIIIGTGAGGGTMAHALADIIICIIKFNFIYVFMI